MLRSRFPLLSEKRRHTMFLAIYEVPFPNPHPPDPEPDPPPDWIV